MTRREITIGSGTLSFETGKMAKQANGSVVTQLGNSVVLTTACMATSNAPAPFCR